MADGPLPLPPISRQAFRVLREVEDTHWWFDGMETITRHILREAGLEGQAEGLRDQSKQQWNRQVLDAGCGTGRNLGFLKPYGNVTGLDHSAEALGHCRDRGFQRLVRGSVNQMPFANQEFDLVTCFDVLITDGVEDTVALSEFARVLRPGGHLFVRVAAYDWLRSYHDTEWSVRHRYNRPELRAKLAEANLEIRVSSYANTFLFPIALLKRFFERLNHSNPKQSDLRIGSDRSFSTRLLRAILSSEAHWINSPSLAYGLSLVALARKPTS